MYRLAICDDEQVHIDMIMKEIQKEFQEYFEIDTFLTGKELIQSHLREPYHMILLDIRMPEMNGFEVSESLKEICRHSIVCFVTSEDYLVKKGYQYNIFRFISKAELQHDMKEALGSAIHKLLKEEKQITFMSEKINYTLLVQDIILIEARLNYIEIVCEDQTYIVRSTLKKIIKDIDSENFIQISRGTYINFIWIEKVDFNDDSVTFKNISHQTYISKSYLKEIKHKLILLESNL